MKEFFIRYPEMREEIQKVKRLYPMKISDYYLGLIKEKGDAIWKQCIPDPIELKDDVNEEDPLLEEEHTPVPGLVHRYPDRVLLLVSNKCAMYCRFCTRKRKVGKEVIITREMISNAIDYMRVHPEIRDVIVSGGDPLMLADGEIEFILSELRSIPHIEVIRIGTRTPCTLPSRITPELCGILKKYHPLFINVHFNHPSEITPESTRACSLLADAGIPLGNQCVLLKGVNDDPEVMKELFHNLLAIRVKPYYMYQADCVKGTEHFRTDIQTGLDIIENLTGFTSGLCIPQYIIDSPGGGKIPVLPDYVQHKNESIIVLKNFENKIISYTNPQRNIKAEAKKKTGKNLRVAIVFNLKRQPEKGQPEDLYAEFDDINVPRAIKAALEKNGHSAELVEANHDLFENLKKGEFDFAFNIAEGLHGTARESQAPAIMDMLGIPYTGSGVLTQAITLDKSKTKEILLYHRVPTPKFQLFRTGEEKVNPNLRYPLFVKPNAEGSSKGIRNSSLVNNEKELRKMAKFVITKYRQEAIVEEYLEGREFTISIIGNPGKVLPIVEITFDYLPPNVNKFDSYEVKWYWDNPNNPIDPIICPAKIDDYLKGRIEEVALNTYKALGCVDLTRMDVRLDKDGTPNIIDVNALPGLMPDPLDNSRFPKSCYAAGMTYDEMIMNVFNESLKRHGLIPNIRHRKLEKRINNESRNTI